MIGLGAVAHDGGDPGYCRKGPDALAACRAAYGGDPRSFIVGHMVTLDGATEHFEGDRGDIGDSERLRDGELGRWAIEVVLVRRG